MKNQKNHFHALSLYSKVTVKHFIYLSVSVVYARIFNKNSVTFHLPLEIQHPDMFMDRKRALLLIKFGERLKQVFQVPLFWENAPLLMYGTWELKYGQTDWNLIPQNIDLCLDVGHLILGCNSITESRIRIKELIRERGNQIKHLHIHENDLIHDKHQKPGKILNNVLLKKIKKGRSFIYEL